MAVDTHIYDKRFFKNTFKLEGPSARSAVNIIIKHIQPKTVIDIGCGSGIYLKEFLLAGIEILGYDGSLAALEGSLVGDKIKLHDLTKPLVLNKKFDLCLCIEVAEHLPEKCSDILIKTIINLSDIIIFTAATPGQGPKSIGHINEQPHEYWVKKFAAFGFILDQALTDKMRGEMKASNVVWWVTKNLMVFRNLSPSPSPN